MKNLCLKPAYFLIIFFAVLACNTKKEKWSHVAENSQKELIRHATGFSISVHSPAITVIKVNSPWPEAKVPFSYALIKKGYNLPQSFDSTKYDAVIRTPVQRVIATSTTHIAALEALSADSSLIGFPNTAYISSKRTRKRVDKNLIRDLGKNESINTELALNLTPDVIFGFSINSQNNTYKTLQESKIPIVYNGDWVEETPLGKAEWIKFFAAFYQLQKRGDSIFNTIENNYKEAKKLALSAKERPSVLSGALYKDVWYLPGGKSWAARFIEDANANYLWKNNDLSASLALSVESVIEKGLQADFWISPSQFTSYEELMDANQHYLRFKAYKEKKIYTFARTRGATGGLLYYELGPSRPDLVLKDLIHTFHPELLEDYEPFFFKPLE